MYFSGKFQLCLRMLFAIGPYIEVYLYFFLNVSPFDCTAVAESEKVAPLYLNHTGWMAVYAPTDRPK